MKRLLLSTALVAALMGSGVTAQTTATMPTITAPDGYARQDTALTVEQLLGATIYDANGVAVGEVQDLVFDAATGTAAGVATGTKPVGTVDATGAMSTDGTAATGTGTDATTGSDTTGTAATDTTGTDTTGTATSGDTTGTAAGTAATETDTTGSGTTTTDTAGARAGTDATTEGSAAGADATGTASTTGTEGTTSGSGSTADTTTGTDTTGADATTVPDTTGASTAPKTGTDTATGMAIDAAKITHAVLDVGGFLGMGEHRVAVPMEDLMLYTKGTDVRVYMGWTKDQLEAQTSYNPNDATTLGRSMMTPAN